MPTSPDLRMRHLTIKEVQDELGVTRHVAHRLRTRYAPKKIDRLRSRTTYIRKLVNRALYHGETLPALRTYLEAYRQERNR